MMLFPAAATAESARDTRSDSLTSDLLDDMDDLQLRSTYRQASGSVSSTDSFLSSSSDDERFSSNSDDVSAEEYEEDIVTGVPSFLTPSSSTSCRTPVSKNKNNGVGASLFKTKAEQEMTAEERSEALRSLVAMNTTLVNYPSCNNYLMEDRIAAHKLSGMKTAKMLTGLCWSLSRPEVLSGPLITRHFLPVNQQSMPTNRICSQQSSSSTTASLRPGSKSAMDNVMIMQWNVLSQAIGYHCDRFATCAESELLWSARKWKIIFEISQYSPDIICLQEVDRFYFIHKMLQKIGYDGKFLPKPDSPCYHLPDNTGPDGCAIFYNTNRFVLFKTSQRILRVKGVQSNQVALLCHFKCKASGRVFAVCTTHLKARKSALLAAVREEQGLDLLHFVRQECGETTPFVVTGDFNAEACEPVIRRMRSSLSSAYDDHFETGFCPPSNWTQRVSEEETKQTVDYIFYQKDKMRLSSVLDLYCPDLVNPVPNDQYPSDHLSLAANFTLMS